MPKKTRKEKILAKMRKLKRFQEQEEKVTDTEVKAVKKEHQEEPEAEDFKVREFFVKDFKRSLILILAIIGLEIAIYFGTISNYF